MDLVNYWPSSDRVSDCIRTEAETADEAVLLAVHQQARLVARWAQSGREDPATESDLLDALLTDETDGSAVLVPITGPSGVGKSHMIRWLRAVLRRHKKFSKLHLIDIPKTASLRQVIELILEPLRGEEYRTIRRDFKAAISRVSEEDAAQLLATNLSLVLKRKATEMRAQVSHIDSQQKRTLLERLSHAQQLPLILQDIVFAESLAQPALIRIVKRALRGASADLDNASPGAEQPQFENKDLILSDARAIEPAAREAKKYYTTILLSQDGRQRDIAVKLLNECIDEALRGVFRFSQTLGSRTIEDIFDEIRRQLLKDGKELVLLIEDFASLSGIQEPLLKLCIAETEREGKQVRAQLRTAIAVTDGFEFQRDTILTRAKREWVIQSKYSTVDELIDQCIDLAGRYLNAARWGKEELHKQFANATRSGSGLTDWVRPFRDTDNDAERDAALDDFGFTEQKYALFPFNRSALRSFCESALKQGGALSFNPRIFINAVLQPILGYRRAFIQKEFPPGGIYGKVLAPDIASRLAELVPQEDVRARLETLIKHWCGNPRRFDELASQPRVLFEAFGLKPPIGGERPSGGPKGDGATGKSQTPTTQTKQDTKPEGEPSPNTGDLEKTLDVWVERGELPQNDARAIRNLLADAVTEHIDFPQLRIPKSQIRSDWFFIPDARTGNPNVPPKIKLSESRADKDGAVRKGLLALRRHELRGSWDYVGGEDDYAFASQLVERLRREVEDWLVEKATRNLAALMERLEMQSRIVGTLGAEKASLKSVLQGMFDSIPPLQVTHGQRSDDETKALELLANALKHRQALIERVLEYCKCSQGERGTMALGLDVVRIERALQAEEPELPALDNELKVHVGELAGGNLLRHVSRILKVAKSRAKTIEVNVARTERLEMLAKEVQQLAEVAFTHNLGAESMSAEGIKELSDRISKYDLKEIFAVADALPSAIDEKSLKKGASLLGATKLLQLIESAEAIDKARSAIQEIERRVKAREVVSGTRHAQDPQKEFERTLAKTEQLLNGRADDTP